MVQKQQYVTIKGTKDGFTLILDDRCSYDELLQEIEEKLSVTTRDSEDDRLVPVFLETGNRYLTESQIETISELIRKKKKLVVERVHSNVITKAEAEKLHKKNQIVKVSKMVRSGQVLEITGDLLLIGDVNPGAKVIATGNVFVLGVLRGIAHAGSNGYADAVIIASRMEPSQLRIANIVTRAPDSPNEGSQDMECAFIDKEKEHIRIEKIQTLSWLLNSI